MPNNICPECKTENEPEYQYCKNCGTPLVNDSKSLNVDTFGNNAKDNSFEGGYVTIDGNSIEETATFIGKNASKYVPEFIRIEQSGSKVRWCWAPFILGFFLGPIGPAIWFLYRKMFSFAAIFGAVGVALSYISYVFNNILGVGASLSESLEGYLKDFIATGTFNYNGFLSIILNRSNQLYFAFDSFNSSVGIASAVLAGIFGIYLYKRHTAKSIMNLKSRVSDSSYLKLALSSKGGTSVGAVILGLIIYTFLVNIPQMIYGIFNILRGVLL